MENYSYNSSYPESGNSSPRSREIDFENTPSWEDHNPQHHQQLPPNYKVKFMCSYGGKIHPRPHDNQLSYISGETKILSVDRSIKLLPLLSKLSSLSENTDTPVSFKYQLPGEDLDALISVTNDDDLEHMMHEFDRLYRASPKPARLRLFIFPNLNTNPLPTVVKNQSFGSDESKSEKDRFVEALNSGPIQPPPAVVPDPVVNNMDFLFGLEKGPAVKNKGQMTQVDQMLQQEVTVPGLDNRVIGLDPIQKHIEDMQRLRIVGEEQGMFSRKSDENLTTGMGFSGEYYGQKVGEKVGPVNLPGGYWPENQVLPASGWGREQPVYMIPAPAGGVYHAPQQMGRQVTGPSGQGYYAVQRMGQEVYRDQPVYNVMPTSVQTASAPVPATQRTGMGIMKTSGGVGDTGYAQVAYDSGFGRQVFYTAPGGGVVAPPVGPPQQATQYHQGMVGGDMRPVAAGVLNQESAAKVIAAAAKVSQTTV